MPSPDQPLRDEHRDATRAALVASARRRFASDGFAATSVDDIAADARVTKGAIYHHFASKEELFRSVYLDIETEVETSSAMAASTGSSAIDAIQRGVDAYLDAALKPDVQRITLIDAPAVLGPEPNGDDAEQPGHLGLRALIAGAVDSGEIQNVDDYCLASLIRGSCLQGALLIARAADPADARTLVGATLHTLIQGLAPR